MLKLVKMDGYGIYKQINKSKFISSEVFSGHVNGYVHKVAEG